MGRIPRHWWQSSTLTTGIILVAALVGMVNYLGFKYYARWDWTRSGVYSLSEKSQGLLAALDRDIEAVVFMNPEATLYDPVMELLSRYEAASPRFSVRVVDPARNLLEAQELVDRFQLTQVDVVVFGSGDDRRVVEGVDLADYDYSGLQFGEAPEMTGFKGEQAFTGAILELVEDRQPSILFTVGHGELALDEFSGRGLSQAADLLRQDNFALEEWVSLGETSVPAETDLIVIAGPTAGFVAPELDVLREYLAGGGRMLVMLDPVIDQSGSLVRTGLEDLLSEVGVAVGLDIIVDPGKPIPFYGAETFFADGYGDHAITRSLAQASVPVILRLARSVSAKESAEEDVQVSEVLRTSSEGWGETDLVNLDGLDRDDADLAGPVSLAVTVSRPDPSRVVESGGGAADEQRLLVIGDADFAANSQLANVGNTELLLSAVNWLVEREDLIGIPPKTPEQVRLTLSGGQLEGIAWTVFGLLPGLALAVGIAVYVRRRR